tara:strand:- start:5066 stop:5233 length:168 start_codon:yes stop_codon:yes gene_type:complete
MKPEPSDQTGASEKTFSGRETRQGDIILRTPARRFIFIAGLAGFVLLVLLGVLLS